MVQVSYPGVYVQEVPSGSRTITGVATSIALFVGMASRGPVNEPREILNFSDYVRTFSDNTALGEMTDQVRQFFLNGGQRAYIIRVAHDASSASRGFGAGGAALTLTSRGAGADENSIQASFDFNTDNPDVTFNLTVYRQVVDAAGNATATDIEIHRNLSLVAGTPRFVENIVNRDSRLVTATVGALTASSGSSIGGRLAANVAAFNDILEAQMGVNSGRFVMSVPGLGTQTITIAEPTVTAINNAVAAAFTGATAAVGSFGTTSALTVTVPDHDVLLSSAAQDDIAEVLGLGIANGGYERGAFLGQRPAVSGVATTQLLEAVAAIDRADFFSGSILLDGPEPVEIDLSADPVVFPDGYDGASASLMVAGTTSGQHLVNVQENLQAIATHINQATSRWFATVQGARIVVRPLFGNAATGTGASLTIGDGAPLSGSGNPYALGLQNGLNGSLAEVGDYSAAFLEADKQIDLFNLLILPRSAEDVNTPSEREQVWGAASSFCQQRRAFLLIDAPDGVSSASEIVAATKKLRIGLKKDHAGLYWPRVAINPDGVRRYVDPSGTIAGLMSRIDGTRGVWKAPAGIEAELLGTLGVEVSLSDAENGVINPEAVNAIRLFPNGIISWGSRTMDGFDNSGNDDYKYVPVRRLALFIAESLERGLKFAVFEPNDEPLWAQIRLAAGGFMNNLFRRGAFQGRTSREAYFVKVDSETTTQNDINLGIVNVVVGFAPLKPAEFVVVTLKQQAGQIQI